MPSSFACAQFSLSKNICYAQPLSDKVLQYLLFYNSKLEKWRTVYPKIQLVIFCTFNLAWVFRSARVLVWGMHASTILWMDTSLYPAKKRMDTSLSRRPTFFVIFR